MKRDMAKEKLKELLVSAEGHPIMQKIKEERAAELLAKRQAAANEIDRLRKKQADGLPKLEEDLKTKEAKYLKAKAALDVASGEYNAARNALSSQGYQFDNDIRQHEMTLYETADERIDEAIQFFRDKLDYLRSPGRISSRGMDVERNIFTESKVVTVETNRDAVLSCISYCRAAIKFLESMKMEPAFDLQKIEELKKVPSIEIFADVSLEKSIRQVTPSLGLKSDSQIEWEIGKLNEKFKNWKQGKSIQGKKTLEELLATKL